MGSQTSWEVMGHQNEARAGTVLEQLPSDLVPIVLTYFKSLVPVLKKDYPIQIPIGHKGKGPGEMRSPYAVAVDPTGNMFVADLCNDRVQIFDSTGVYQREFGSLGHLDGEFDGPTSLAIDPVRGTICCVDNGNHRAQVFTLDGVFKKVIGGRGEPDGRFRQPRCVALDPQGIMYITDDGNCRVQSFTQDGEWVGKFGERGLGEGRLQGPSGIAVGPDGLLYVSDSAAKNLQVFTTSGEFIRMIRLSKQPMGMESLGSPWGIAVDRELNIVVAEGLGSILSFNSQGEFLFCLKPLERPRGVTIAPNGNLVVANTGKDQLVIFGTTNKIELL